MNKRQSNKLNSYLSMKGVLEDHVKIYASVGEIKKTVDSFFRLVDEINTLAGRARRDTTGETAAKNAAKKKLASTAGSLAALGSVFAMDRSDTVMEAALGYSYSDLRYARDAKTLQMALAIEYELTGHRADLARYMVSEQDLAGLHALIKAFEKSMEIQGGVKSESVALNARLSALFRETDTLLNRMLDRFISRLKPGHPAFYEAYRNARTIVDL
ncbi:MAG: hypothetical protein V2B15_17075 [Bacteroidota bacterium]